MKVTYMNHSGFVIEFQECVFIFDYYKGKVPNFNEKPIYVFISHKHYDHFSMDIFKILNKYPKVTYILSSDIKLSEKYLDSLGFDRKVKEQFITAKKDVSFYVDNLNITTLKSTDEGVAFLIQYNGKLIYHGGDLNWWHWYGESTAYNNQMAKDYKFQIDKLKGMNIDVAFVPVDPRLKEAYDYGLNYILKTANIKHCFPMHLWGKYSICKNLSSDKIIKIERENQEFEI